MPGRFEDVVEMMGPDWFSRLVVGLVLVTGSVVVTFDVLKKTVFLGASWNYDFPPWTFVYDVPVTVLLVVFGTLVVVFLPKLVDLSDRRFVAVLYVIALSLYGLSLFALPEKTQHFTLRPTKGIYYATTYLIENGPVAYFQDFHTLGLDGSGRTNESMLRTTELLTETLRSASYLPFNEALATYAGTIRTNLHGPMTPVLVAPFLLVFGSQVESAILGSYVITAAFPVVAYFTFRLYFTEFESRAGAFLVLFSPAFFIYLREKTIPYDPILGVVSGLSTYLFLLGITRRSRRHVVLAGFVFSVAALIKVSVIPLAVSFVIIAYLVLDVREATRDVFPFTAASLALPVGLLFVGYNFVVQYLFAVTRLFVNAEDFNTIDGTFLFVPPDVNVQNPILVLLVTYYNIRLVGLPILVIAIGFVAYAARYRDVLTAEKYLVGVTFLVALLPILPHMQLQFSRHMLGVFVALGFMGVCGLSLLGGRFSNKSWLRFVQFALIVTFGISMVNL